MQTANHIDERDLLRKLQKGEILNEQTMAHLNACSDCFGIYTNCLEILYADAATKWQDLPAALLESLEAPETRETPETLKAPEVLETDRIAEQPYKGGEYSGPGSSEASGRKGVRKVGGRGAAGSGRPKQSTGAEPYQESQVRPWYRRKPHGIYLSTAAAAILVAGFAWMLSLFVTEEHRISVQVSTVVGQCSPVPGAQDPFSRSESHREGNTHTQAGPLSDAQPGEDVEILKAGDISLCDVALDSGIKARLIGPAVLDISHPQQWKLKQGRLLVIRQSGTPLRIEMENRTVEFLGTRAFLDYDGEEVSILEGKVRIVSESGSPMEIEEGQRLNSQDAVEQLSANESERLSGLFREMQDSGEESVSSGRMLRYYPELEQGLQTVILQDGRKLKGIVTRDGQNTTIITAEGTVVVPDAQVQGVMFR